MMMNKKLLMIVSFLFFLISACGKPETDGKAGKEGEVKATLPATPTGVAAVSGSDRITVKWNPTQGASSYNIYYSDKPGIAKTQGVKISAITATSYEHAGLKQAAMHYYVVTASNESGESPPSAESGAMVQPVALQAPVNVAASGGDGKITLKWKEVAGATSYAIYYATIPGVARSNGKKITGITTTSYQLKDIKKKTMYFFAVTAVNSSGESPASNETGAMP